MQDSDALEDYRKLIQAVIDYSVTNYIKLQHPLNRKRKPQHEDFLLTLDVFYDPNYTFEHFVDSDTEENMTTQDMLDFMLGGAKASMTKTHAHIVNESIDYWWDKNFHDIKVPEVFTIAGKVWRTVNSPNNSFIDKDNLRIYMPVKKRGADRLFFKLTFQILLEELEIELSSEDFQKFHKFFYLLLKVNGAFNK